MADKKEKSKPDKTDPKVEDVKGSAGTTPIDDLVLVKPPGDDGEAAGKESKDNEPSTSKSWGGWLSSTLTSAKEKSTEMYQYIKQDLSEFGESVHEASRDLKEKLKLEDTARSAVCTMGDTMNTIFDQVSTIFGVGPDDEDEIILIGNSNDPSNSRRVQSKVYALALEENVFLEDPYDMEEYESWAATFDLSDKNSELADLLTANPHLQLQYSQLVPERVSHLLFWHRFYYQVYLILQAENELELSRGKSEEVESKKDEPERESPDERNDQSLGTDIVDISEEDQKRLLTEYEEEMKKGHSRGSSGTHLSSSSSGSFAFVTHDLLTDEVKVE